MTVNVFYRIFCLLIQLRYLPNQNQNSSRTKKWRISLSTKIPISGNFYKIVLTALVLGLPSSHRAYSIAKERPGPPTSSATSPRQPRPPSLQVGTSTFIPESNAACFFLADNGPGPAIYHSSTTPIPPSLIPTNRLYRAEMLRWMFFE